MTSPLSQTQSQQVREEVKRQLRPFMVWLSVLVVGVALGAVVGVYAYTSTFSYARTVSCQRGRAVSIALGLVVHTAIPPHASKHHPRTAREQRQVDAFYRKVGPALKVPSCN